MLYSMLRRFKPKRVIEVGSGFSSGAMLDVNESSMVRLISHSSNLFPIGCSAC